MLRSFKMSKKYRCPLSPLSFSATYDKKANVRLQRIAQGFYFSSIFKFPMFSLQVCRK